MDIREIVKKIASGEIMRDNDETGAGGFWDLAGILQAPDNYDEETQEAIYNALYEIYYATYAETMDTMKKLMKP